MDPARAIYEDVRIWPSFPEPIPPQRILQGLDGADRDFIAAIYEVSAALYEGLPRRRNGQAAFTHPTNVALFLIRARAQPHVVAAGLLHDVLEDRLDLERGQNRWSAEESDRMERAIRGQFAEVLIQTSARLGFPRDIAERVVEVVWTLTRHKADMYYKSISGIFNHPDSSVRRAAALVKLADRMHNIQTIENYDGEEQIYQCFKNIFILNNAKQMRSELAEQRVDPRMTQSLEKMFKKCGKATYQALLRIDHAQSADSRLFPILTILSLALRKFVMEVNGLWTVTQARLEPGVPVFHLYHGIIKKYDHRLHHEHSRFQALVERELNYCRATFEDLGLSDEELRRSLQQKDAMALKEVVASLLYREDYIIRGFQCSQICRRNQNCLKAERSNGCDHEAISDDDTN